MSNAKINNSNFNSVIRIKILRNKFSKRSTNWSSCYGTMGLIVTLQCQDTGSIPGLIQWVKDLALLQLQHRSQPWFRSDPWPGNYMCCGVAKRGVGGGRSTNQRVKKFLGSSCHSSAVNKPN